MSDCEEAQYSLKKMLDEIDPNDRSYEAVSLFGNSGYTLAYLGLLESEEVEKLMLNAIEIAEEKGYKNMLGAFYTLLDHLYYHILRLGRDNEKYKKAHEKALYYIPYSSLADYAVNCQILAYTSEGDERIHLFHEASSAGLKSGNVWATVLSVYNLGNHYLSIDVNKALEFYETGWNTGIKVRWILGSWFIFIAHNLIEIYAQKGERSKLLKMTEQVIDATFELHSKAKVHPTSQKRWNDTVEQIYQKLHDSAIDVYYEFERKLVDCLNNANNDGERFFYLGQLLLLAAIDNRRDDVKVYVEKISKLKQSAGTFADRISEKLEILIKSMNLVPNQVSSIIKDFLTRIEQLDDLSSTLIFLMQSIDYEIVKNSLDFDEIEEFIIERIKNLTGLTITHLWVQVERLYEKCGFPEHLSKLAKRAWQEAEANLRSDGISQLSKEHYKFDNLGEPDFIDIFDKDPISNQWKWLDPEGLCEYSLSNPGIEINVSSNIDLWPGSNKKAPRLIRKIDGDFMLETHICDKEGLIKQGGLLVWKDDDNYIRFEIPNDVMNWSKTIYYGANVNGKFVHPGVHPYEEKEAFLRLERKGDRFTGYVSSDGENWYSCGWADFPIEDPIKVGIFALSPGNFKTSTRFEYFKIYRKT